MNMHHLSDAGKAKIGSSDTDTEIETAIVATSGRKKRSTM